jgi:hypothetical protein
MVYGQWRQHFCNRVSDSCLTCWKVHSWDDTPWRWAEESRNASEYQSNSVIHSMKDSALSVRLNKGKINIGPRLVKRYFFSPKRSYWLESIKPLIPRLPCLLAGEKTKGAWRWPRRPSTAEVKNKWSYTSSPPTCLHGLYRDNSAFITFYSFSYQCT